MTDPVESPPDRLAVLEAALEATQDGIVVLDRDRRVSFFNRQFLQMFGLADHAVRGHVADQIFALLADQFEDPAAARDGWPDPTAEALDTIQFKDGRVYQRFVAPRRVGDAVVGLAASYRDITPAVRSQEELDRNRAVMDKAEEVARLGSWIAELDGSDRFTCSAETCRIFGAPARDFATTITAFFAFAHPEDASIVRRAREAIRSGQPLDCEHRIVRSDGTVRWVHERADVMRGADGAPLRMIGTTQDITHRRRLEEHARQVQRIEAVGRLAGGIAHDLNNSLTAIVGFSEIALGALDPAHPAAANVAELRRSAERAEIVTRQLLAFSRKQLMERRIFRVSDAVKNLSRFLEQLLGKTIELHTTSAPDVPPILGDPGQIEEAIANLAMNSKDAMPGGGRLTLAVSLEAVDEAAARAHRPMMPGQYVLLTVSDTGRGMDAETQTHVFEPFFTTKEAGKGTGLGLAMVYGTVKQNDGFIFMESEIDRGTTFRLFFPPAADVGAATRVEAPPPAAAREHTVLVVEDEPAVRHIVMAALRDQGLRLLQAASGQEALAIVEAERDGIDLLLTDANMPGMSGIELANTLVGLHPQLRVVIMSGYTQETLEVQGLPKPVSLLTKPFTPKELRRRIHDVIQGTDR